jgi:hypothetical protein
MLRTAKSLAALILVVLLIMLLPNGIYGQEAKFQQMDDGLALVCMEAENYSTMVESQVETYWEYTNEPEEYSGEGAMQCGPAGHEVHQGYSRWPGKCSDFRVYH